jgi:two-component sensor histidine kinase
VGETDVFWRDLSTGFTTKNIICVPLQDEHGEAFGVLQAINRKDGKPFKNEDVSVFETFAIHVASAIENAKKFDELEQKLEDQELYLNEIHHRLKNNLAAVSAVLELELDEVKDEKSRSIITAAKSRIKSVGVAHSLFYEQEQFLTIEISQYLNKIIDYTQSVYSREDKNIVVQTKMEPVKVSTDKAMLCGLIVNELLINAFKHAFIDRKVGLVEISVERTGPHKVAVCVTDDGLGFEDEKSSKIKGMFIVKALARKLQADIQIGSNQTSGCKFKFSFSTD